jgi:tetratricopeptide (TPR) repeat protein
MELVKGVPITKYCDEHHLTCKGRLELFLPVCQAIQHAHQKGIIHRDIKPNNVLVAPYDGKPVVKVIDFGVAKAAGQRLTDKTLFTEFGAVVGTLEYMSPEQAELNNQDIDTRSDIYSLGVLLYELLTGTTPLQRQRLKDAAFLEVLRRIREEEPPRPSTRLSTTKELPSIAANRGLEPKQLTGLVRGELDWIVMKALEKDRNRRYETANAFAADVQRYLTNEPVLACPPSAGYRLRKFVRRNRGPVLAGVLVLVVLLGGIIGTTWGLVWANNAREAEAAQRLLADGNAVKALEAKHAAEEQRDRAAKARDRTCQVLDQMTSKITDDSLATQKELSPQQKKFLTEVLQYYREFAGEKADDKETRERTAKAAFQVGVIEARLGRKAESAAAFRQARDEMARLAAEFPTVAAHRGSLATTHGNLGVLLKQRGQYGEALKAYEAARVLQEKLAAELLNEPRPRWDLADSYMNLGNLHNQLGQRTKALEFYQAALAQAKKLVAEFPKVPEYRDSLADAHQHLGNRLRDVGKQAEALEAYREALSLGKELVAKFPEEPMYR